MAGVSGEADKSDEALAREPRTWRAEVLQGLLWSTTAIFASVTWFVIAQGSYGTEGDALFLGCSALVLAGGVGKRFSYALRASLLLATVTLASLYALLRGGYAPNAFIALGFVVVTATLLVGVRAGIGFVLFFTLVLVVVPALHRSGAVARVAGWPTLLDSANVANSARISLNFLVLSASSVLAISYLLRRSEKLLQERTQSLERLAAEEREKERIRNDLLLREAAFHKAAELEILGRLSGSMAHDYNNALVVIFAALDDLGRAELAPGAKEAVAAIRSASAQAASATRQLRAFGPRATPAPVRLLLGGAVKHLANLLVRVLPSNIVLSVQAEDDLVICADEGQIQRMLTNLVLNARDAMRDGGRIALRATRDAKADEAAETPVALIEVEDNGTGMSEEVRQRLFEPFFTTKGGAGTGLGLASVRELAEAAGGRVSVQSELGVGSKISVYWPLERPETSSERSSSVPARDGTGINVLLVDNDALVRDALARGLRQFGFGVVEAADGREALVLARRHGEGLHLLCTDCVMPGVPLRDLIAGFRHIHPTAHVLVCSGYSPDDYDTAVQSADEFMGKPFDIGDLAERLLHLAGAPWHGAVVETIR